MPRNLLFYLALLLLFGAGIYGILRFGARLESPGPSAGQTEAAPPAAPSSPSAEGKSPAGGFARGLFENVRHPLSRLLLQVLVIVAAAKLLGSLFAKIRQPPVIGEMIAGILLGPSLLGLVAPGVQTFLFPADSLGALQLLSQVGVILFMFVVGIELDLQHLRQKADAAVLVSHASIVVPFFLGVSGALLVYRSLAPAGIPFNAFALFLGVALSITAFPVLARILEDRGMSKTSLGSTAIACAAVDDVTAWCLLAVVVALVRADGLGGSLLTILLAVLFIAVMLFAVRPWAGRVLGVGGQGRSRGPGLLAGILLFVFASALFTEVIGIHALFGAFLAGVAMPPEAGLRQFLRERLETFSSVFLLPLFFAFTGLRTEIGLLDDWRSWLVCAGIIAVAIAGKLGGSMLAARWTGMGWRDSVALGVLMNTRGLVELIVLNLGYDLGILSPRIFAMMVVMALVTTFMTGPLLNLLDAVRERAPVMPGRSRLI
ncbi:MAG TPA: cation:proton antiporter [Thermoanaerobaculia bacterium]|nr:cation:proton antiporter [Thermoanaerobaculia bacterium]